jgi:hypothetical protein
MEKSFRAQSWLGIIKGSNVHIDFSTPEEFDLSFEELIRQITFVERRLSLQPRKKLFSYLHRFVIDSFRSYTCS